MNQGSPRLIILDPRSLVVDMLEGMFRGKPWFCEILSAATPEAAIENAFQKSSKGGTRHRSGERSSIVFLVGGFPYLKTMTILDRLSSLFPSAKVILLDELPRHGCSVVARRLPIHGYFTLYDTRLFCSQCVESVVQGRALVSPLAERYLEINPDRQIVACPRESQPQDPQSLVEREWICFQHLVAGKGHSELAKRLNMKERSARNLQYEMMKSLGVRRFHEVLRKAHDWGLFDQ